MRESCMSLACVHAPLEETEDRVTYRAHASEARNSGPPVRRVVEARALHCTCSANLCFLARHNAAFQKAPSSHTNPKLSTEITPLHAATIVGRSFRMRTHHLVAGIALCRCCQFHPSPSQHQNAAPFATVGRRGFLAQEEACIRCTPPSTTLINGSHGNPSSRETFHPPQRSWSCCRRARRRSHAAPTLLLRFPQHLLGSAQVRLGQLLLPEPVNHTIRPSPVECAAAEQALIVRSRAGCALKLIHFRLKHA